MAEINLFHLISVLIRDFEHLHGRTRFEIKKVEDSFIYTKVSQNMLDILKLKPTDVLGQKVSYLSIGKGLSEKDLLIYEKAWAGKEMIQILFPTSNENACLVIAIQPVLNKGKTEKLICCCATLDSKEFRDHNILEF